MLRFAAKHAVFELLESSSATMISSMLLSSRLLLLLLFAVPLAAVHADILIYSGVTSHVQLGDNETVREKSNVYTLIDTVTKQGFSISYRNRGGVKTYQRGSADPEKVFANLTIGKGKTATVIMWPIVREVEDPSNIAESLNMVGQDTTINTGTSTIRFPAVFAHEQISIEQVDESLFRHHTWTTRLLLNRAETRRANKANATLEEAADYLAYLLQSRGYTFEPG
jgi:hypothetical protein